ncbi:MAG: NOG1 family protein [Halanaeroarchaeum sp.]
MIFEGLPTTPTSDELLDKAFSRAARSGRAKRGVEAQESMLQTASNILSDNLENVVNSWPDFETVDPFYYELADALVDVDDLRQHLSRLSWAARKTHDLGREYTGKLPRDDPELAIKIRKQGFARMGSVLNQIEDDLSAVGDARDALKTLPDVRPDEPAIVVAGYPNVGKTAFVNAVTNAHNETAAYPFTTRGVAVGHFEREHVRYQLVDTPGLLDRPAEERNEIESQAVSALTHLADAVLFVYDASETCDYDLDAQRSLHAEIEARFDAPVITACNKADLATDVEADHYVAVPEHADGPKSGQDPGAVLDALVEAIGYEPDLPFEESGGTH